MKKINLLKIFLFATLSLCATQIFAATTDTPSSDGPVAMVNDSAVTGYVKGKIALDKNISVFKVGVSTSNGIVYLDGKVDSDSQAATLIELAESVAGVKDVDASKLSVKTSTQPISDILITGKVKGLFIREKLFNETDVSTFNIHVETKNGVVYLSGVADDSAQINNAVRLAQSVSGVIRVESSVKVGTAASF